MMTTIRHTKKLDKLLGRYNVRLREDCSVVSHLATGETTLCDPLTFAVFKAAIKAVYLSNALSPIWAEACEAGHDRHYRAIARSDEFDLPDPATVPENNRERTRHQATKDYHYCVSVIAKAGLYYALLD